MKTLGLIGGMSWESTAVYYQHLNQLTKARLGGLHSAKVLLWSFDFAEVEQLQASGRWDLATERMIEAARNLQKGGAEALVICTNTMHKMAPDIRAAVDLPLLHIADATASALQRAHIQRPLLLATRFTMEQDFYRGHLSQHHQIETWVPPEAERAEVHRIIYEELCRGDVLAQSRDTYLEVIRNAVQRDGIDGVILGCTEITLLLQAQHTDLPLFDTTQLHAAAAMDFALEDIQS